MANGTTRRIDMVLSAKDDFSRTLGSLATSTEKMIALTGRHRDVTNALANATDDFARTDKKLLTASASGRAKLNKEQEELLQQTQQLTDRKSVV